MLYVLFIIFVIASPVIVIIAVNIWYINEDRPQPALVDAIYACANEGSLHTKIRKDLKDSKLKDRNVGLQHPHRAHPDGLCADIKTIIHQSIRYCEECEIEDEEEKVVIPLVRPEVEIKLSEQLGDQQNTSVNSGTTINENQNCPGIEWIRIADTALHEVVHQSGNGNTQPEENVDGKKQHYITIYRPADIDLPNFCKNREANDNMNPEWELLEQPRVYNARTWRDYGDDELPPLEERELPKNLAGGPYAVFIAKHLDGLCCEKKKRGERETLPLRDKTRVTIFIVYVDYITEQPNIIEINIEVESGKPIVGVEDTIQLVSNVKLDSLKRQATFQIGQGARRIVVAGYDFNAESTRSDTGPRRRSEEDTSGSYVVKLDDTGAVRDVCRVDYGGDC